ncbi:MAG: transcriptional regulator GcvA [Acetobacteraceae bacterium]
MRQHIPPLGTLQAFEAAARHLSFTRAAAELHVTQSAVSRHIRGLEVRLGVTLFRRTKQHVELTEAGQAYLPEVRASLDRIEASTLQLQTYRRGAGVLNISVLPTFGTRWLMPRLAEFFQAHRGIVINFYSEIRPFEFANSEIDAAIHFGPAAWTDVIAHRLLGEQLVPVCAPALLDAGRATIGPDALARFPLLQLMPLPDVWSEWLQAAGIRRQVTVHGPRFEHFSMAIEAAIAGHGVLLVPDFLVADDIRSGRLVVPHGTSLTTNMAYHLIYPRSKRTLPWLRIFRDWLLGIAAASEDAAGTPQAAPKPVATHRPRGDRPPAGPAAG